MKYNELDLTGMRFGKLIVNRFSHSRRVPSGNTRKMWECICECKEITVVASNNLRSGNTQQCKKCSNKSTGGNNKGKKTNKYCTNSWVLAAQSKYGTCKFNYDKTVYVNSKTKVNILCNVCNNYFLMLPTDHLSHGSGCPNCFKLSRRISHVWINNIENKICGTCKQPKPLNMYSSQTVTWDNLSNRCKDCSNNAARHKYKTDYKTRKDKKIRGLVKSSFRNSNLKKNQRTCEILGASTQIACDHIEKSFDIGMTWDNTNLWMKDHIIPLDSFLKKARKNRQSINRACIKANYYTNFQALWNDENLDKSNKLDWGREEYRNRARDEVKRGIRKTIPAWYYIELNGSLDGY